MGTSTDNPVNWRGKDKTEIHKSANELQIDQSGRWRERSEVEHHKDKTALQSKTGNKENKEVKKPKTKQNPEKKEGITWPTQTMAISMNVMLLYFMHLLILWSKLSPVVNIIFCLDIL